MSFWRFYDNVNPFYSERTLKKTESLGTTKAREQKKARNPGRNFKCDTQALCGQISE